MVEQRDLVGRHLVELGCSDDEVLAGLGNDTPERSPRACARAGRGRSSGSAVSQAETVQHADLGTEEHLLAEPAGGKRDVHVVEPDRRPLEVIAPDLLRKILAVHHAAAERRIDFGIALEVTDLRFARSLDHAVKRPCAGGLCDLRTPVMHAIGADDVEPVGMDPSVVHDHATADHADPFVRAVERDHPLEPPACLDRGVGVELHHDLARSVLKGRVERRDDATVLALQERETVEPAGVAPPTQDVAAGVRRPVVYGD